MDIYPPLKYLTNNCPFCLCCRGSSRSLRLSTEQIEDILSGRTPRAEVEAHKLMTSSHAARRTQEEQLQLQKWMKEKRAQKMKEFHANLKEMRAAEVQPFSQARNKNLVRHFCSFGKVTETSEL